MTAGEFRNGVTFEMDGQVQQVIEFQHVKPGKGAAFVRVKMKNVVTGAVTETSFNPTAKFEEAFVERREMQYLYNEGDLYYFMDNETYEQIPISKDTLGDDFRFVKENENFLTRAVFSQLSHRCSLSSRSLRPSRALKATLLLTFSSPLPLRPVLLLRFRSLSSRVSASRSTPVPVSIWAAARPSKNLQPAGMAAAVPDSDI